MAHLGRSANPKAVAAMALSVRSGWDNPQCLPAAGLSGFDLQMQQTVQRHRGKALLGAPLCTVMAICCLFCSHLRSKWGGLRTSNNQAQDNKNSKFLEDCKGTAHRSFSLLHG